MAEATPAGVSSPPPSRFDIGSRLPLQLIKSEIIPPAPSRSGSGSADFLLDFAGHSWIAYGAASLVVICHFPNPMSEAETEIGPIYRQVLELYQEADVLVSAVCWSPATPSVGELAVALDDRIVLLSYDEGDNSRSSSCWRQTTKLVQSMKVEAIQWTGSGDGIVSGGIDVVMWRRKDNSWERAWSFKPKIPQALVSTTWSAYGLSATAPWSDAQVGGSSAVSNDARDCVLIFQFDGHSKYPQHELRHPGPIRMIQWRPSTGKPSSRHLKHAQRPVLLTYCIDGVVRLWGEIDDGRIKRTGKDNNDQKTTKLSFCVLAVIEVNQTLNGYLGSSDVFVRWAVEVEGVALIDKEFYYYSCLDNLQHGTAARCEWLIGFGPKSVMMWAIHCLDDFAPVRLPRVTLWKQQDLTNSIMESRQLLIPKVLIMRTQVSDSPALCLSVQLSPCNSFSLYQLYSQTSASIEGESASDSNTKSSLTACAKGLLEVDGHSGKILQIVIHPFSFEVELAVSLDSNGMLLFWSFSTFFNSHIGLPISTPSWKLCGKTSVVDHSLNYTCLSWAPILLGNVHVLLMGHSNGIDCFMVEILKNNKHEITFHNLFSLPVMTEGHKQGLTRVDSIPLPCNCSGNSVSSKFLLIALWMDNFLALSWEITFHCYDSQRSCSNEHWKIFESDFSGKKYLVTVDPCSSVIPTTEKDDMVTSCSVVYPGGLVSSIEQKLTSADEISSTCYVYHMVTGYSNGSIKLWRSIPAPCLSSETDWALVGALSSEQGPILAVSPSPCGQKIVSASKTHYPNFSTTLCIWECMHVKGAGSFMLEDKLCFDGEIVAFNWLKLGIGQLLLAVCSQNELRIYASQRRGGQGVLKSDKHLEENAWICIAANGHQPPIFDFVWGPKGMAIVVHDKYFSLFSHFLSLSDYTGSHDSVHCQLFTDSTRAPVNMGGQYESQPHAIMNTDDKSITRKCFWSMSEIAEMLGGSLPLFHPEALLNNLCSGNWKRAFTALRHLVKQFASGSLSKTDRGAKMPNSIVSPVPLSDYLEGLLPLNSSDKLFQWSSSQLQTGLFNFAHSDSYDAPNSALTLSSSRSEFDDFVESLERLYALTCINIIEKMQALALIDILREVGNANLTSAYKSLDEPGRRFWVAVRFQQLYFVQKFNRLPLMEEFVVSSEAIGWAFHSDCHDNLFNSLISMEPSWQDMRSMGVGFWYTNVSQLRVKMERLARQRYVKNKDPKACTLLYIALNRLQVLAGLFKISKDEKDKPLAGFLCRNFQEDQHKAAAIKNAYVLLGKHQLELAVAFFLLGGDASSAVTVCAKNLGDEQLALVICRLIEGCGGPLERNLILKFLLPSALSKGDFWMASFLEWLLGNYSQSFNRMLGAEAGSEVNIMALSSSHTCFLDPSIGQYCLMLGTKTNMKNAIGEHNAAILCRWAYLMNITSFRRCGLPLEALECLLSSVTIFYGPTHGSLTHSLTSDLPAELEPSIYKNSSSWIREETSCHILSYCKLYLALQYISNLMSEHPSCLDNNRQSSREIVNLEVDRQDFENLLKEFEENLTESIAYFQKKFSLIPLHLISMIVLSLYHNGLEFIGNYILRQYAPKLLSQDKSNEPDNLYWVPADLLKATAEMFSPYMKFVVASCKDCSRPTYLTRSSVASEGRLCWLGAWGFSNQGITQMFMFLRAMLQLFLGSQAIDFQKLLLFFLSMFEFHILFASAWLQKNFKAIIFTIGHILSKLMGEGDSHCYELKMEDLNKHITEIGKMLAHDLPCVELRPHVEVMGQKQDPTVAVPDDKDWPFMIAAIWVHMSKILEHQLSTLSEALDGNCSPRSPAVLELNGNNLEQQDRLISSSWVQFLKLICSDISFYCSKQFATYLLQEVNISNRNNLSFFEDGPSQPGGDYKYLMSEYSKLLENGNKLLDLENFRHICAGLKIIHGSFQQEYRNWLPYFKQKSSSGWSDAYASIASEFESEETWDKEDEFSSPRAIGSPLACLSPDHPFKTSGDNDTCDSKVMSFQNPKEIYRRNGELLEALCINSVDQSQAALASNKKGILFFNWEDGVLDQFKAKCTWGEADWPHNGWAGSESTPVPTYVSSGRGLGSKKSTHLGLREATIGAGSSARPGGELTGGGAFGIPGYAGMGASSLDWGLQESFDEFLDPPATIDNVRTGAFASHPCRPLFLVGSSNTHIYLWEFGKDRATATYGVLPAANVPPPYALASVSAVQFDHCGHRFVTAGLDGTVCTWQLEVGGRNNICPTESSVCFNNHTADVTYVTASGSIVAAAGYSSNGVNVVVWDTLAPPATSQASIMCHEGGARSLSVFDNDIGSGSVSPLILTGGKGGDVGLHDFRYIATGRTKKHKHLDPGDHNMNASSSVDMRSKTGDQNRNGMLWYIPKAHSGCVTKISTIPNTSFFLTGSKDGDVKLWDAKRAKLVYHWPKLHERHTFLQHSSRGFGGVVRDAVTDIQVVCDGFLTCGGDGIVKYVRFQGNPLWTTN